MIKIVLILFVSFVIAYGIFSWICFLRDIFSKVKNKKADKHVTKEE